MVEENSCQEREENCSPFHLSDWLYPHFYDQFWKVKEFLDKLLKVNIWLCKNYVTFRITTPSSTSAQMSSIYFVIIIIISEKEDLMHEESIKATTVVWTIRISMYASMIYDHYVSIIFLFKLFSETS